MDAKNVVVGLRELLGYDVLLLRCRAGTKRPVGKWKGLTVAAMEDPLYLAKLAEGNIGVALGPRSGGLCSLDIDSNEEYSEFVELNRGVSATLRTCGARGANLWWRLRGQYPPLRVLERNGADWGEWRADGAQTMIWGRHPSGCFYRFLERMKPLEIDFEQIRWPAGVTAPAFLNRERGVTESTQSAESTKGTEATDETDANSCGKCGCFGSAFASVEQVLEAARATGEHENHKRLFTLARGAKALEAALGHALTESELESLFSRWYDDARPHLRRELGWDDYYLEFMEGYDRAKYPLGAGIFDEAWKRAAVDVVPPEALRFKEPGLQMLVSLCRQLWLVGKRQPFFLSCRKVQQLFGHGDHMRGARWLRGLVRLEILEVVEVGTKSGRATRYRYLGKA